ncbi:MULTISPECIES: S41 family peptidase [Metasolibacillus]|uniref:lmo1851 family serine protease n=1 Tax=Metasolibacillus TaxID=2703677 RepID=UPI00079A78B3|nr:S41 family peptidase [Metasolibacillus fluoroglycofenilyticus]KYG91810.1 peptidase S41 [[Bacillus] sp. KCTC 13219]
MDEQQRTEEQVQQQPIKPAGKYISIKPFKFIMLMFLTILVTAGLTIFALTFGEQKVVEVKVPVERTEFKQLYDAFDELKKNYYVEIDDEKVIHGAINGMFDALEDPYSDYMNREEAAHFNESLSSSFQGIGAEIQERDGYIMVVSPIKNSPAEKAGILPKDLILSVDGESLKGLSASEAVLRIRGEKGTSVTLMIQRGDGEEPIEMKIVRDDIPIETVHGEMGEDKIAHISISSFSEQTAKEVAQNLAAFEKQGMKGLVLDVRQNPGGYLTAALEISNFFVEEGKPILLIQSRTGEPEAMVAEGGKKYDIPVTVLIDEGSASASEILAGALQESAGAKIVGKPSFGKGTVQTVTDLPDGANLKFTTSKWLTPNGNWINEKGIVPDIDVDTATYASLPYIDPKQELKLETNSKLVNAAEQMLEVLGYEVGNVDNLFDEETEEAVKQFQVANNLEDTGVLSGETTYALMDALREKLRTDDPQLLEAKKLLIGEEPETEASDE